MNNLMQAGLVLEGGGTRGIFSAGVIDFFIDKNIYFQAVMVFQQVHVMLAVIFPVKKEEQGTCLLNILMMTGMPALESY